MPTQIAMTSAQLVTLLRDRAYSGKSVDSLCEQAANEIERLRKIINDYAAICEASSKEINRLNRHAHSLIDK
jgi:hypothetical protein